MGDDSPRPRAYNTQVAWPKGENKSGLLGLLLPSAHAQVPAQPVPPPSLKPSMRYGERLDGDRLIRMQEVPGGRVERTEYDIRSGRILSREITTLDALKELTAKAAGK